MRKGFVLLLLCPSALIAQIVQVSRNVGGCRLSIHAEETKAAGKFQIAATVTNEDTNPVQYLELCMRKPGKAECTGSVWVPSKPGDPARWKPGDPAPWNSGESKTVPILALNSKLKPYTVDVTRCRPDSPLFAISNLFVGTIDGNNGAVAQEELKISILRSGRFHLVESLNDADAVLTGRSDVSEAGEISSSVGGSSEAASYAGIRIMGTIRGSSESRSDETTRKLIDNNLLLRLTKIKGDGIWGWDNTQQCPEKSRAKCAVHDLVREATPVPIL